MEVGVIDGLCIYLFTIYVCTYVHILVNNSAALYIYCRTPNIVDCIFAYLVFFSKDIENHLLCTYVHTVLTKNKAPTLSEIFADAVFFK